MDRTEIGREDRSIVGTLAYILFGPIVWAVALTFGYGPQSALCALAPQAMVAGMPAPTLLVLAVSGAAALAILLALWQPARLARRMGVTSPAHPEAPFLFSVMRLLALLSLFGVIFFATAAWLLPACGLWR